MNIVVTGKIGIGKTTVCHKVIGIARSQGYTCGGIITPKTADEGIIIEDVHTGEREALASISDTYNGPRTRKYFFNPAGIKFGNRAIDRGVSSDILLIDEIGHLELGGQGFVKALELIGSGKVRSSILVIRSELLPAFLSRLRFESLIFETTSENRAQLPEKISAVLFRSLSPSSTGSDDLRKQRL